MKIQWQFLAVLCLVLALALAGSAQSAAPAPAAPAPAPTTLSAEERELALKSLQATHDAFLKSITGLSEKQWRFKPAPTAGRSPRWPSTSPLLSRPYLGWWKAKL